MILPSFVFQGNTFNIKITFPRANELNNCPMMVTMETCPPNDSNKRNDDGLKHYLQHLYSGCTKCKH